MAFLAIVLTASSCGCGPSDTQFRLDEEFSLSMGQRASIAGENLAISFEEVVEDSRCPTDVVCIWAGRVTCMVGLTHAGSSYCMTLTETEPGLTEDHFRERYGEDEFTFHVTPYFEAGRKIPPDAYRLHLPVSKLPKLTNRLGSITTESFSSEGQDITVAGTGRYKKRNNGRLVSS